MVGPLDHIVTVPYQAPVFAFVYSIAASCASSRDFSCRLDLHDSHGLLLLKARCHDLFDLSWINALYWSLRPRHRVFEELLYRNHLAST